VLTGDVQNFILVFLSTQVQQKRAVQQGPHFGRNDCSEDTATTDEFCVLIAASLSTFYVTFVPVKNVPLLTFLCYATSLIWNNLTDELCSFCLD
jgi:hypothetical protein